MPVFISFILIFLMPLLFWQDLSFFFDYLLISLFLSLLIFFLKPLFKIHHSTLQIIVFFQLLYSFIILIILNTGFVNGDFQEIILVGDQIKYYQEAIDFSIQNYSLQEAINNSSINYSFYQFIVSLFLVFFDNEVLFMLFFSTIMSILSLIFYSAFLRLYISIKYTNLSVILIGLLPHFIAASTSCLKDSFIVFSFALLLFSSAQIFDKKNVNVRHLILFVFSFALIFFLRIPFLILFLLFVLYVFLSKKLSAFNLFMSLVLIFIVVQFIEQRSFSSSYFNNSDNAIVSIFNLDKEEYNNSLYGDGITSKLVSGHKQWSIPIRIISLPLVSAVQYFNPINFFDFNHFSPWSFIDINLKIFWVLLFGPLIIFSYLHFNLINSIIIRRLLLFTLFGYLFVAFQYGGLIPRYALVFYVSSLIPVVFILQLANNVKKIRIKLYNYFQTYNFCIFLLLILYLFIKI